jgi:ribosome maturation factor RimP
MSLESDIKAIVESVDLLLYDTAIVTENGETIYRVSVQDKNSKSVTLDQCVELTHLLSPLLDVTPPISGEYRLEVGSAGIERKLTRLDHFVHSIGENVKLYTKEQGKISGVLKDVQAEVIYLEVDGEDLKIPFDEIIKAHTYFQW